jgi:formamidopyrimidine-DNA glycosylase
VVHARRRELSASSARAARPDFTAEWLFAALRERRRLLKPLLLDQTFLAGWGTSTPTKRCSARGCIR